MIIASTPTETPEEAIDAPLEESIDAPVEEVIATPAEEVVACEKSLEPTTSKENEQPSGVRSTKRVARPDKRISPVKQHRRRGIFSRDIRFGLEVGQIGPKLDKSRILSDQ